MNGAPVPPPCAVLQTNLLVVDVDVSPPNPQTPPRFACSPVAAVVLATTKNVPHVSNALEQVHPGERDEDCIERIILVRMWRVTQTLNLSRSPRIKTQFPQSALVVVGISKAICFSRSRIPVSAMCVDKMFCVKLVHDAL